MRQAERGWDAVPWKKGFTLLHWAARRGAVDWCQYLLTLKGDPAADLWAQGAGVLLCCNFELPGILNAKII